MSLTNKFKLSSIALASAMAMGAMAMPTVASADVDYSATVATMNLFRGTDASQGAAMSGDIKYSNSGFYVGAWAVSGKQGATTAGSGNGYELDLFAGYSGEVAGIGYDVSYWDVDYPQIKGEKSYTEGDIALSYKDFSFMYAAGLNSGAKNTYMTLGYSMDKFSVTYGMSDDGASGKYSHIDLGYAATDKLTYTVSKSTDDGAGVNEEMKIVLSYALPI